MVALVQPIPLTLHLELRQSDAVRATLANSAGETGLTMNTVMGYESGGKVTLHGTPKSTPFGRVGFLLVSFCAFQFNLSFFPLSSE